MHGLGVPTILTHDWGALPSAHDADDGGKKSMTGWRDGSVVRDVYYSL